MRRRFARFLGAAAIVVAASACVAEEEPTSTPSATVPPTPSPSAQVTSVPTSSAPPASPTATPEPSFSLDPPAATDDRRVTVTVVPDVGADAGTLTVTVTSAAAEMIEELVLRWPSDLNEVLFIAPFTPSDDRIRPGGPPLVQPWTKWVVGPGEQDEPAGTISVGWGPLMPGATLTIPLDVTRLGAGPVAFDLQILAGNELLTTDDGDPAELRVEVP